MWSTLKAISWIYWLIGTFGVAGTVAILYFAPAVGVKILGSLGKFLIGTRPGVAILAGALCWFVADVNRSKIDQAAFAERTAAFEQAQTERDTRIAAETRASVTKELSEQSVASLEIDKQVKEFHDALPIIPPSNADCRRLGSVAATRLRRISGEAVSRPRPRAPAMPKIILPHRVPQI